MKKKILFLFLFIPLVVFSQQDSSRHDTLILDKFFNFIGRRVAKTFTKSDSHKTKFGFWNDSIRKNKPNSFSISLALQHNCFFKNHYSPADTNLGKSAPNSQPRAHVGRTYYNQFGYSLGINYELPISNKFRIESGFLFYADKQKMTTSLDVKERDIVNNYNLYHSYPLDSLKEEHWNDFYLNVPFYVGYKHQRFSAYFGTIFTLINYFKIKEIYMLNYVQNLHYTYHIFAQNNDLISMIHFSIKGKYLLTQKKYPIWLTFAADRIDGEFYLQLGAQLRLIHF